MNVARPPIPLSCADRPTQGGYVVPYVATVLGNGTAVLAACQRSKVAECFVRSRCQICARPLARPIVFFATGDQLPPRGAIITEPLLLDAPPMHAECATYSTKACPMVAGRQGAYRGSSGSLIATQHGERCDIPGCDCGGWLPADARGELAGTPAPDSWYAVWVDRYDVAVDDNDHRNILGALIAPEAIRRTRLISERIPREGM